MKQSEQLDKLASAFAKTQGAIEGALKDKTNPAFRSKYADLGACWDACRNELSANGLSIFQGLSPSENGVIITTRLLHSSGQWLEDEGLFLPATKKDAQGFGSAVTYARRYALCAVVGIAPEDDDGNAASKHKPQAAAPANITPTGGVWENESEESQAFLQGIANHVISLLHSGDVGAACDRIASERLGPEEMAAIWTRFDSKQRSAMKAHQASKPKP